MALGTVWRALGTTVVVLSADPDANAAAVAATERVVAGVDAAYSRFRPDSELSRITAAGLEDVHVSPLLARAVAEALRAARLTGGAVDPTVGAAMRHIGYEHDFAGVAPEGGPIHLEVRRVPGWQAVELDEPSGRLRLPRGCELDLGSTGKALAADLAAEAAAAAAGSGVLVGIGGDIATAGAPPAAGWTVLVAEDSSTPPTGDGQTVTIHDGALATSSTTVRRWRRGGVTLHHIVDPATGLPAATPWRTVTVAAATCVDANAAATAAIVRGVDAPAWLEASGLDARLVSGDGAVTRTGRWPA